MQTNESYFCEHNRNVNDHNWKNKSVKTQAWLDQQKCYIFLKSMQYNIFAGQVKREFLQIYFFSCDHWQ